MNRLRQWWCGRSGHYNVMVALPADGWGLYAYSRLYCSRCGRVEHEPDIWAELGTYNANRGLVYSPWFVERMAVQQEYWYELQAARAAWLPESEVPA